MCHLVLYDVLGCGMLVFPPISLSKKEEIYDGRNQGWFADLKGLPQVLKSGQVRLVLREELRALGLGLWVLTWSVPL